MAEITVVLSLSKHVAKESASGAVLLLALRQAQGNGEGLDQ